MLVLITLLFVIAAAMAGAVEYWFWLQPPAEADPADQGRGARSERSLSVVTESLAVVGAVLVLVGSGISITQRWLLVTNWERVTILAVVAIAFLIAGFGIRWLTASVTQPLTELMWCVSAACLTGAAAVAGGLIYHEPAAVTLLIASGIGTIYSVALWLMCRREVLMTAVFTGLIGVLCGAIPIVVADATPILAVGLGLWLFGLAWTVLGWMYPEPLGTSIALGAALALAGPAIAVHEYGWAYVVGIGTSAAVMAASVPLRNIVLVAFGACALLGYIAAAVLEYTSGSLGVPESLTIIGLALVGLAFLTVRLGRASRQGPRAV